MAVISDWKNDFWLSIARFSAAEGLRLVDFEAPLAVLFFVVFDFPLAKPTP
jgi:hypothetical protein